MEFDGWNALKDSGLENLVEGATRRSSVSRLIAFSVGRALYIGLPNFVVQLTRKPCAYPTCELLLQNYTPNLSSRETGIRRHTSEHPRPGILGVGGQMHASPPRRRSLHTSTFIRVHTRVQNTCTPRTYFSPPPSPLSTLRVPIFRIDWPRDFALSPCSTCRVKDREWRSSALKCKYICICIWYTYTMGNCWSGFSRYWLKFC